MQKEKLDQFLGQVVTDLAAASSGVIVRIGHRLGFYRALAESGALTPGELARAACASGPDSGIISTVRNS